MYTVLELNTADYLYLNITNRCHNHLRDNLPIKGVHGLKHSHVLLFTNNISTQYGSVFELVTGGDIKSL